MHWNNLTMNRDDKFRAASLWEKTSERGNRYFVGRLGGVRILIFENKDRKGESDPTHVLYFADGEKRSEPSARGDRPAAAATAGTARARPPRVIRAPKVAAPILADDPTLNDPLPPGLAGG